MSAPVDESVPAQSGAPLSRARLAWLLLALAIALGGAFPYFGRFMNANERPRILQAIAFIDAGELAIDGAGARGIAPGVDVSRSPVDDRLYPNKPPGTSAVIAVAYALVDAEARLTGTVPSLRDVTRMARWFTGLVPTLVLCGFAWRRYRTRHDPRLVGAAILLYALATPVLSYARLAFGHQLAACLLFVGMLRVLDAEGRRTAFFGGALAGSAIAVEYAAAFAGVPLAVWLGVAAWRNTPRARQRLLAAGLGAALPLGVLALYHHVVFGSVLSTPYHHVTDPRFAEIHGHGLLGLGLPTASSLYEHLLSPWGGLVYWAPLLVLALGVAIHHRFRTPTQWSSENRWATATFVVVLVVVVCLEQTGGWRVGPRYLVMAFPFLLPALIATLAWACRDARLGAVVVALTTWSLLVNVLAAHLFPHLVPHGHPLVDLLWPVLWRGLAPYHVLGPLLGEWLAAWVSFALCTGLAFAGLWWLPWAPGVRRRAFGFGLVVGSLVTANALLMPVSPEAERDFDSVAAIWEPRADGTRITVELGPLDPPDEPPE